MTYAEAMRDYGSDKPDLRVTLKLTELTDLMRNVGVQGVPLGRGSSGWPRRGAQRPGRWHADAQGDRRIHHVCRDLRREGPCLHQSERCIEAQRAGPAIADREISFGRHPGANHRQDRREKRRPDLLRCRPRENRRRRLGALRAKIGHERGFAQAGWRPLWVVDFPMFEYDEQKKTWGARHHPFTAPKDGHEQLFDTDPGNALAKAYDVVLNGWEIGGGSVRIHRPEVQAAVFKRAWHRRGGSAKKVRLPAGLVEVRRAAARRHRLRRRSHGGADGWRRPDSRRHRLSQDPARAGPADRHAVNGHRAAVTRIAYPYPSFGSGVVDAPDLAVKGDWLA